MGAQIAAGLGKARQMQAHTRPLHRLIPNAVDMLMSEQKAELFRRAAAGRGGLDVRPSHMGTGWWAPLYLLPGSKGAVPSFRRSR